MNVESKSWNVTIKPKKGAEYTTVLSGLGLQTADDVKRHVAAAGDEAVRVQAIDAK